MGSNLFELYDELIDINSESQKKKYSNYRSFLEYVDQYRKRIEENGTFNIETDKEFISKIFLGDNAVSSQGSTPTSHDNLLKLFENEKFSNLFTKVVLEPNIDNWKKIQSIDKELLEKVGITNQPLRFNRLCASATKDLAPIPSETNFKKLKGYLLSKIDFKDFKGWFAENQNMVNQIREVFKDKVNNGETDEYWLNIFLWEIYDKKIPKASDKFQETNQTIEDPKGIENMCKQALNQILYGPAGTGKTYHTINHALAILDGHPIKQEQTEDDRNKFKKYLNNGRIKFVTFHQSYGYEEFIEGIKVKEKNGQITYSVEPGIFKQICESARENPQENYVLIIDEINRGNISKIFGELITLIEDSKRAGKTEALPVTLPHSPKETFSVPSNLYIIGTMNSSDRSLTSLDLALRRRFEFIEMLPDPTVLEDIKIDKMEGFKVSKLLETINKRIKALLDQDHCIGHANFTHLKPTVEKKTATMQELMTVFEKKIIPLLQEYFFNDWDKIKLVLGDNDMITNDKINEKLFPSMDSNQIERLNSRSWKINTDIFKDFQKSKDALSKIIGEPKTSKEKTEIQDVDA